MINFLLVKDKEIPVYLKYWYYKTKIEGLVFNKIYEATKVGTSLVLDNTIEHSMKINLLASDTTQFTTNGYQLFDKNHANILNATFFETKTLAASANGKTLYISCKPNTTYTINKTSSQRFRILTTEEEPDIGVIGIQYMAGFTETTQRITTDSNVNYLCVYYYLNGTDTKTEQEILDSIMIYEGLETLPYEPYTGGQPSPNPDYPQDIHVVKGDNTINIMSKNYQTSNWEIGTINSTDGLDRQANNRLRIINYLEIPNETIKIKIIGNISQLNLFEYDTTKNYIRTTSWQNNNYSFTPQNNTKYIRIVVRNNDNIMTLNDMDKSYVYIKEQNYPITLGDVELCKIGSYQDLIFKNTSDSPYYDSTLKSGKWYKLAKIGKVVLNGSEVWVRWGDVSGGNTSIFGTSIIDNLIGVSYFGISNNFINKTSTIWNIDEQAMTVAKQERSIRIRINNIIASTIEEFKDWLSTHNTIVYYVLETSTKTLLSDTLQTELDDMEENATTYNEETNITQVNDDRPFILDVSYFRKVKYNE